MPRLARVKTNDSIFHIMCRSISEVDLFKNDDDKLKYIELIKNYRDIYEFKVYGYCLMDNHVHLLIDANGADISSIMHSINFSYAGYFNRTHKRHGHLFQDRFKSKIIANDRYLFAVSAYIHNNVTDVIGYRDCPEKYEFSSLSVYLGLRQDPFGLVSSSFVLSLFGKDLIGARERYKNFVYKTKRTFFFKAIEFEDEGTEYRSGRTILIRNYKMDDIINFIVGKMNVTPLKLHIKNTRNAVQAKALLVLILRSLCNIKCCDISRTLGNITQSRVSKLCKIGLELVREYKEYNYIIQEVVNTCSS